jgi:cytochrome c553
VRLPDGAAIDVRKIDQWEFPAGTRFWKEFTFAGRKVETRFLRKNSDGTWTFASYAWNEEQTDAILAPEGGLANVAEVAPGKFHSIPAVTDCKACHEADGPGVTGNRTRILGFNALQLSTDRDPAAPHAEPLGDDMVTLRTLAEEHALEPSRPELVAAPPRIDAADARSRAVLGYLSTNCGSCHNEESSIANLGLLLKASVAPSHERRSAIEGLLKPASKWQLPQASEGETRYVTPGAPDLSALLVRMKSRRPSSQMPPLGTVIHDREAVDLVTEWIAGLDDER